MRKCGTAGDPTASPGRCSDQGNSPSRWRFRPPHLLAFRLRVLPSGVVSTYSRSVLGAIDTLRNGHVPFKGVWIVPPHFVAFAVGVPQAASGSVEVPVDIRPRRPANERSSDVVAKPS